MARLDIEGLYGADAMVQALDACQKHAPARIMDELEAEAKLIRRLYRKRVKTEAKENTRTKKHLRLGMTYDQPEPDADGYKCEMYNNYKKAPHYHLVENGHIMKSHSGKIIGYVEGKKYFARSMEEAEPKIDKQRDKFVDTVFKEVIK